jgi:hypothetical protein
MKKNNIDKDALYAHLLEQEIEKKQEELNDLKEWGVTQDAMDEAGKQYWKYLESAFGSMGDVKKE